MTLDPRTPVLVGTGQVLQKVDDPADAREPIALMEEAIENAARDSGLGTIPPPDALWVVDLLSWRYGNPARFIADDLRLAPRQLGYSSMGGNSPQTMVNNAAKAIASGEFDLIVMAGGETTRSRSRAKARNVPWTWRTTEEPPVIVTDDMVMNSPEESRRGIVAPVQVYPMFETAIRAAAGRTVEEHQVFISELYARFSAVAVANPNAWNRTPFTAEEIRTPSPSNRMIGFPYPKLMNSNNQVDMAAALIMCSVEKARSLGIAQDRWVFPLSGADTHEHPFISNRDTFARTPAVEIAGRRALELADLHIGDISIVDLYSCFPSAVQLGAQSLGLDIRSQLTRTGGLQFGGGPWNNYVMHAIATVVNDLRESSDANALVWANGGYATKHSIGVYSTSAPTRPFAHDKPQAQVDALFFRECALPEDAAGDATIEAYSVMHDRDGNPEKAIAACLLPDGRRAWGASTDTQLAAAMCIGEWVARPVRLDKSGDLYAD